MKHIIEKIKKLKEEKNAIILAHSYQNIEIDEVADYVGDSLYLSQMAQKTNATLVPFGIAGDYIKGGKNLVITFGEPFKVAKEDSLEEANEKLRNEVGNLIKKGESYTKK